jgi:predicted Ser/Thr protein kinase
MKFEISDEQREALEKLIFYIRGVPLESRDEEEDRDQICREVEELFALEDK